MDTKSFKTKSEILEKKMPKINGNNQHKIKTIVALDGGYSSVKGVSPNKVFMIPSYAKKAPESLEVIGKVRPDDLLYRDDTTGEVWLVGRTAETLMDQVDVEETTDESLYTRYRYNSEVFKVIMNTGLALGLLGTGKSDEIYVQTGLPAKYKDRDSAALVKALEGHRKMSIKVGNNPWASFEFDLPAENIGKVMEQPQGTLCACIYNNNGDITSDGKGLLQSKGTIILDIGFGTEDIFSVRSSYKNNHQTYADTAMRAVFDQAIKMIKKNHPKDDLDNLKIFELQSYLETGSIPYFNVDEFKRNDIVFGEELQNANMMLCEKSIRRLMQDYNNLNGYENVIVTGGTGESRYGKINQMLSGFTGLHVFPGNINFPDLSFAYSNVLGYYMFRYSQVMSEMKKAGTIA